MSCESCFVTFLKETGKPRRDRPNMLYSLFGGMLTHDVAGIGEQESEVSARAAAGEQSPLLCQE